MTTAALLGPCVVLALLFGQAQQPAAPAPPPAVDASIADAEPVLLAPPPLAELRELVAQLERGDSLAVIERASALEAALAVSGGGAEEVAARAAWTRERRAHLAYTAGLAEADAARAALALETPDAAEITQREEAAVTRFLGAVGLAGPGELRSRSMAAPGALIAQRGERQIRATQSQAMLKPSPIPYAAKTPERVLLEEARASFERARALLVDRLQLDWHDVDTRANLEWVGRRLAEIQRIAERADQQQEEQDEQQQEENGNGDQDQSEPNDQGDQGDKGDQGDQSQDGQKGDQPQDTESQGDQEQSGDQGDQQNQDQPDSTEEGDEGSNTDAPPPGEETGGEEQTGEEQAGDEGESDGPDGDAAQALPATLGDVEVQRLLNRLAEIEQNGEETRRRLRASQRRRVERDW